MRAALIGLGLVVLLGLVWTAADWRAAPPQSVETIDLRGAMSDQSGSFATVTPGRKFSFPADHGEHPEFKTEWWYFTGNLKDDQSREYGYQLTVFRAGLNPPEGPLSTSPWSSRDVFMAHFALSQVDQGKFHSFERFGRRSLGLSGVKASEDGLSIWLEDWRMRRAPDGLWRLSASETAENGATLELLLELSESKPPVLQGDGGYSRKGPRPEHASYYVSLTRLSTSGVLRLEGQEIAVRGSSWFDHEWSSSALAPGLVGWDWFSLQLDDGWDLMIYLLRDEDGKLEPASSGTLIDPEGQARPLTLDQFKVEVTAHQTSPRGVRYPSAWTILLPSHGLELRLTPTLADQEMASGVPYWEGAVRASGERNGRPVLGSGFVEMTGYARAR